MKLLLAAALSCLPLAGFAACRAETVDLRDPTARFSVEVADDPAERAQGLMNRASLPRSSGMLFVYERPQTVSFWMRNTLIPLDMIFMDATGTVRHVYANAVPKDDTPIPGGDDILAVLEINGGLAARMGIVPGTVMRHPALDPAMASWPCTN